MKAPARMAAVLTLAGMLIGGLGAAIPSARAAGEQWPTPHRTDGGLNVRGVQAFLTERGYPVAISGYFGWRTEAALQRFQRAAGLAADGIAGPRTWPKLVITLRQGSRGESVKVLQGKLAIPYRVAIDGTFGARTVWAVKQFQRAHGIAPDGVVGPLTWLHLANVSYE